MSFLPHLVDLQYVNITLTDALAPVVAPLVESDGLIDDIDFSVTSTILTWTMPRAALGSAIDQTLTCAGYPNSGSFYLRSALDTKTYAGYYIRRRALQFYCPDTVEALTPINVAF
jgi:hypothetical protein